MTTSRLLAGDTWLPSLVPLDPADREAAGIRLRSAARDIEAWKKVASDAKIEIK
jgi:hypothetical protein